MPRPGPTAAAAEQELGTIWDGPEPTRNKTHATRRNLNTDMAALTATMYGYGGHGAYIPVPPPQRPEQFAFWDQQKITDTVNRKYVLENIGKGEGAQELRRRLDTPMSFGDDMTDCTYAEWIVDHAAKFFVVLVELGAPEKIFQVVEGSWDDDDLPLTAETVGRLGWNNSSLEKRFLKRQHMVLLRMLMPGDHVDYLDEETVAIECATAKRPSMAGIPTTTSSVEKVYFPRTRDVFYTRARVPLGPGDDGETIAPEVFLAEIEASSAAAQHKHIVQIHSSYTHQGCGYLLLTPCCELNLKQFIQYTPYTFKSLPKDVRRKRLLEWTHCLADGLAHMYERGVAHRDIRPRSIVVDQATHQVLWADIGNSRKLDPQAAKQTSYDVESYEYAAPELWQRAMTSVEGSTPTNTVFAGRGYRKSSVSTASTATTTTSTSNSAGLAIPGATSPHGLSSLSVATASTSNSASSIEGAASPSSNFHLAVSHWVSTPTNPSKSDVFSLGAIFLDMLTFLLKRRAAAFAAHRAKKQRRPRQSAAPDASFHANLGQVDSWIDELLADADKKGDETLRGVLALCRRMLDRDPLARPQPRDVADALARLLAAEFGVGEMCCRPAESAGVAEDDDACAKSVLSRSRTRATTASDGSEVDGAGGAVHGFFGWGHHGGAESTPASEAGSSASNASSSGSTSASGGGGVSWTGRSARDRGRAAEVGKKVRVERGGSAVRFRFLGLAI